jgi:transposase
MAGGRDVILPELPRLTPADGHDRVDLAHGAYSPPHSCSAHPGGTHPKTIAEQKALAEMWLVTSPITSSPCSPPTSEFIQPPRPGQAGIVRVDKARLHAIVDEQPSISGRLQVNTALAVMDTLADHLDRLLSTARSVKGARALMHDIYGVGSLSSLALCAWLGGADRFSSSRKAVRFVGLDITVHSSDGKRGPGRLYRQGPEVLRWLLFEAAKTSARTGAPGYGYDTQVKDRYDANRACLSQARRIVRHATHILTGLGDDAFTIIAQPAAPTTVAR